MTGWPGWRPGLLAGRLDKLEVRNSNSNQWGFALCSSLLLHRGRRPCKAQISAPLPSSVLLTRCHV